MRTYDEPYALDSIALNVKVELQAAGILDREGGIPDLDAFKTALVTSLKKPITVLPGEDLQAKLAEGHAMLTRIKAWVVFEADRPVDAGFRLKHLAVGEGQEAMEYVIRDVPEHGVQIVGEPPLDAETQVAVYRTLALSLSRVQIFDDEAPAVASALRGMLDRR